MGSFERGISSATRFGTRPLLALMSVAVLLGCSTTSPTQPRTGLDPLDATADLSVVFVGNSLTYTNDLPAMVVTIAEAAGHTVSGAMIAAPNYSLEDHWFNGVADAIRDLQPDVVVMQQGPSSLPENQVYLRQWTETLSDVIREVGAEPALFMVWPSRARYDFFADVRTSYRDAASAVSGTFIPAGQAWLEAWDRDPGLQLYGPDDFHPSGLGSAVAALTIYRVLFDEPVTDLPAILSPTTAGLPTIDLAGDAPVVYAAVEAAVAEWAIR